jgi:phosphoenolpyruvate synthase/pyruvate phosphate dikinase
MDSNEDNVIDELLKEISGLISEYPKAIERRAAIIQATGKDPELVEKLVKAADTMRDSGNLYLTWARHYAALAEGNTDASSEEDETEDFDV